MPPAFGEFGMAALGTHLRAGGDIELHVGARTDHRSDIATVEDRAGRRFGEGALLFTPAPFSTVGITATWEAASAMR